MPSKKQFFDEFMIKSCLKNKSRSRHSHGQNFMTQILNKESDLPDLLSSLMYED